VDSLGAPLLLALPALQDLSLAGAAAVDDEAISWLQQLTGLTRLNLSSTAVRDLGGAEAPAAAGRAQAQAQAPRAAAAGLQAQQPGAGAAAALGLGLEQPPQEGAAMPAAGGSSGLPAHSPEAVSSSGWGLLRHLVDLDLSGSPVTAAGCRALAALAGPGRLLRLQLGGAGVDDTALKAVANLRSLQKLRLARVGAGDAGLGALAQLQQLRVLLLDGCLLLTPAAVAQLAAQLPQARQVALDGALLRLPRRCKTPGAAGGSAPGCAAGTLAPLQAAAQAQKAGRGAAGSAGARQQALAALLQHFDERLVYPRVELLRLQQALEAASRGSGSAAAVRELVSTVTAALPCDLRLGPAAVPCPTPSL
jgi:hypothetical protein